MGGANPDEAKKAFMAIIQIDGKKGKKTAVSVCLITLDRNRGLVRTSLNSGQS